MTEYFDIVTVFSEDGDWFFIAEVNNTGGFNFKLLDEGHSISANTLKTVLSGMTKKPTKYLTFYISGEQMEDICESESEYSQCVKKLLESNKANS